MMMWLEEFRRLGKVFLAIVLIFALQGTHTELLLVSAAGPTEVNAVAGRNVTLAVPFSGAPDTSVIWFMGDVSVAIWIIDSSTPANIPENHKDVLKIEPNGSLTFVNVPLDYSSNYTVEMTKPGLGKSSATFTLKVFEIIQNVTLSSSKFAIEGTDRFTLSYSMLQGVVEHQMWFVNGTEINTNSHYSVEKQSLVILGPNRRDAGQYMVSLTNPFSSETAHMNVSVLYGPDDPKLEARPAQPLYESGDSLSLSCEAEGFPLPTVKWAFDGQTLFESNGRVLNLSNIQTSQGGNYTCMLLNNETKAERHKSIILKVYERPSGSLMCSVQSVNNVTLQYHCRWAGGTPEAQLSFPALSNTSSGAGNFSLTVTATDDLNGKTVTCQASHPLEQDECNITASGPVKFQPAVKTTVDADDKVAVTIHCVSEATPQAVVSWSKGSQAVTNGTTYQISADTTQLKISDYNVTSSRLQNFTCVCSNPMGSQRREVQLRGPSISDFSGLPNQEGTVIRLTWEVPPTSVVTGFDIQMKGPDLVTDTSNGTQTRGSSDKFRTIQHHPGSVRSADIFNLNPKSTYRFRVIPKALTTEGEPSGIYRIGPGEGLSGPAIAGIAAGIPCSLLFLLLLGGFIYLCVYCHKNRSRQTRYPVGRAVEKAITIQPDAIPPHNLLTGGLKSLPDYNRLQQTPSERSVALPSFVPPAPVRVATTV
ncbi:V-set and immunoglobulin domain-containing protein 10-like [Acanthopagrus latus]|uniref:V-set and immunoglobulin domain-containing protein 10-like n=1 Tax=Acanthopagrus latus TaxID=8177 RepID=UPI00187CBF4E|nr:V-set and immunoglobulin domain-containing protein 10-like [Acanthopagrus latus]